MGNQKKFTVNEVNELIPALKEMMKHVMEKRETQNKQHDRVFMHELISNAEQTNGISENDPADLEQDFLSLEEGLLSLKQEIQKITQLGCIIRNLEAGQIDFPAIYHGAEIFYSWQYGEEKIIFYRLADSDPTRRIPLEPV